MGGSGSVPPAAALFSGGKAALARDGGSSRRGTGVWVPRPTVNITASAGAPLPAGAAVHLVPLSDPHAAAAALGHPQQQQHRKL